MKAVGNKFVMEPMTSEGDVNFGQPNYMKDQSDAFNIACDEKEDLEPSHDRVIANGRIKDVLSGLEPRTPVNSGSDLENRA